MVKKIAAVAVLAAYTVLASESVFSVNDDIYAFPQVSSQSFTCDPF
jgi:hypothetical protein